MRKLLQGLGVLVFLLGVSGAVDHLWSQPVLGIVLNSFNRLVVQNVAVLQENALFANLGFAVCGAALVLAMAACAPSRRLG